MKIVEYRINGSDGLYDFNTIQSIVKTHRSKLKRDIKRVSNNDYIIYKNQHLYKKEILFQLMEETLIERLDKI